MPELSGRAGQRPRHRSIVGGGLPPPTFGLRSTQVRLNGRDHQGQAPSHTQAGVGPESGVVVDGAGADHGGRHRRDGRCHFGVIGNVAVVTPTATATDTVRLVLLLLALTLPAAGLVGHVDVDLPHALLGEHLAQPAELSGSAGQRPLHRSIVGGGLPPIAEFQSTDPLTGTPPSGASPLPPLDCDRLRSGLMVVIIRGKPPPTLRPVLALNQA